MEYILQRALQDISFNDVATTHLRRSAMDVELFSEQFSNM